MKRSKSSRILSNRIVFGQLMLIQRRLLPHWVVKEAENEMVRLDKLPEDILEKGGPESLILEDIYEEIMSTQLN